jgi:putative ABC transport system ATP-binding protein
VLDNAVFEAAVGEFVALLGSSGCGKSTLLNLIAGIDRPDAGRIIINGQDISALNEHARTLWRRKNIGFVFQFFNLIPTLTVLENVRLPLQLNAIDTAEERERAVQLLAQVGLQGREHSYPERLSGGEQQRLALVRALIHRPALLLADEPTGNLDARAGEEVLDLLSQLVRQTGTSVLMVTHSEIAAQRADRICLLRDGRIESV